MEEKARIEVVGGILWRGGSFLAAQRPEGHPQAGFWEFPGGKVEPGESLEAALARELAEELSLSVRNPRLWRTVEHDYDFRSVTPEEALTLPFLEADRPLLFDLSRP